MQELLGIELRLWMSMYLAGYDDSLVENSRINNITAILGECPQNFSANLFLQMLSIMNKRTHIDVKQTMGHCCA